MIAGGQRIAAGVAGLGLLLMVSGAHAQTTTYTYDNCTNGVGRLCSVSATPTPADGFQSESFIYDLRGNLTQHQQAISGTTYQTNWSYDSLGRVLELTYPGPAPRELIRHSYNAQGLLERIEAVTAGGDYVTNLNYNANGQVTSRTLGNGLVTTYSYATGSTTCPRANNFRLCSLSTPGHQSLSYTYDDVGNVDLMTDTQSPNLATQDFAYDALNRLTSAVGTGGAPYNHTYTYNPIGNLTSAAGVSYSYPLPGQLRPHAPLTAGAYSYQYDTNGNLQTRTNGSTTRTLTWDAENRLTQIQDTTGSTTTTVAQFRYDHAGTRVQKIAAATTTYVGDLLECVSGNCTAYIFANGERVASRAGTGVDYYLSDHLGSSTVVTGADSQTLAYFPYGAVRSGGTGGVAHKFTGQELDEETGLYDYGARLYDPALRRFISADPIGVNAATPQTLNRYAYALNNPLRYLDPSGNQTEACSYCFTTPSLNETYRDLYSSGRQWDLTPDVMQVDTITDTMHVGWGDVFGSIPSPDDHTAMMGDVFTAMTFAQPVTSLLTRASSAVVSRGLTLLGDEIGAVGGFGKSSARESVMLYHGSLSATKLREEGFVLSAASRRYPVFVTTDRPLALKFATEYATVDRYLEVATLRRSFQVVGPYDPGLVSFRVPRWAYRTFFQPFERRAFTSSHVPVYDPLRLWILNQYRLRGSLESVP